MPLPVDASTTHKRSSAPTIAAIVQANQSLVERLGVEKPAETCWRCEHDGRLFRCHVLAHRHGGPDDEARNFFVLCDECHRQQPDSLPRKAQELWLGDRLTRGEQQVRALCRTIKKVIQRIEASGVPPEEVAGYMKSTAFKVKASKIGWPSDYNVLCTSLEYLVAEYLP